MYSFWKNQKCRVSSTKKCMSTCNLAFQRHCNENPKNNVAKLENSLNKINLISIYDPLLKIHIENEQSKIRYLNLSIKYRLDNLGSKHIFSNIIIEVQAAPFLRILDMTQDISKTNQPPVVIRNVCVNLEENIL